MTDYEILRVMVDYAMDNYGFNSRRKTGRRCTVQFEIRRASRDRYFVYYTSAATYADALIKLWGKLPHWAQDEILKGDKQ